MVEQKKKAETLSDQARKSQTTAPVAKQQFTGEKHEFELVLELRPFKAGDDLGQIEERIRKLDFKGVNWGIAQKSSLIRNVDVLQFMCLFDASVASQEDIIARLRNEFPNKLQSIEVIGLNRVE